MARTRHHGRNGPHGSAPIDTGDPRRLEALRRWAVLLDSYFRVPGTRIRFGLDAVIGLVPGLGDLSAPLFAAVLIVTGVRMRLPVIVQARMVLNAAIDMVFGLVPVVGDVVDIAWKANLKNLALLERHARPGVPPEPGDYIFVILSVIVLGVIALAPILLLLYVLSRWSLI
jgi:hypothetical protein